METRPSRFYVAPILFTLSLLLSPFSQAQTTWNTNSGNWSGSNNWNPATTNGPSGVGLIVNLTNDITTNSVVTLDLARTVGIINIGDSNGASIFTLSGTNILTMDNGASAAQINFVASGKEKNVVDAPLVLAGNLDITNSNTLENRISGDINPDTNASRTITFTTVSTGTLGIFGAANTIATGTLSFVNNASNGVLHFNNAVRHINGTITNNAGTLLVSTGGFNAFGDATLMLNGGTVATQGTSARTIINNYAIGGDITLNAGSANSMNFTGSGSLGAASRSITVLSSGSEVGLNGTLTGSGGIIKEGSGTLSLYTTASKQYTGGTTINAGTVRFRAGSTSNVFSDPATADFTINNGSILDVLSYQTLGVITLNSGSITNSNGGLSIITASNYVVQSGSIGVRLAGSSGTATTLTKNGAGTVTLSQNNTYTGKTTINNGTLLLSSGSGGIASTTLGFGVSDISSGVLQVENTAFSFNGTMELSLASVTDFNNSWDLFTGTAFTPGDLSLANLTSDIVGLTFVEMSGVWSGTEGSRTWSFDESSGVLSVVPEPATYGLVALGLLACLFFRRRLRSQKTCDGRSSGDHPAG